MDGEAEGRGPELDEPELGRVLKNLYRSRFAPADLRQMRGVWRVLVSSFFQKRLRPGVPVLDVGAGPCLFINEVVAVRRIALDANPDLAQHAAQGVEVVVAEDLSLREIPDASVGHVFLSNLLEHLADGLEVVRLLERIHRKLLPGGSVLILQPNFRLAPARYFDHRVVLTERSLREGLEAAGYQIREMRVRFLPFTSKSRLPRWPLLVRLYLWCRPAQWLLGKQTFVEAVKPSP
jgi:SAM-dependent methyltransferase